MEVTEMNKVKRVLATMLVLALVLTMLPVANMDVLAAKKVKLNKKKITLFVGQKKKLKIKNKPKSVKVKWKSKKKKIAKVSKKGVVTAKKAGKTTIIAKVGKKKLKCKVVVKKVVSTTTEPALTQYVPQVQPTQSQPTQVVTNATTKSQPTKAPTQVQTTKAATQVQTTKAATQAQTTKAATQNQTTKANPTNGPTSGAKSPIEVVGLSVLNNNGTEVEFVWGQTNEQIELGQTYNLYIDNAFVESFATATAYKYTFNTSGKHQIKVTANLNGIETAGATLDVETTGGSVATSQQATNPATQPATQAQQTVVTPKLANWDMPENSTVNADGSVSIDVPAYDDGDNWATQFKYNGMKLEEGKTYTMTVVLNSTVARKFQAFVQSDGMAGGNWSYASSSKAFSVNANQDYTYTDTFTVSSLANDYLIGVMMGFVDNTPSSACKVTIKSATLTVNGQGGGQTQATTKQNTDSWTAVEASGGKVSYKNANKVSVINVQKPGFASNEGVYATVSEAIDYVTINGTRANSSQVAIDGAGAVLYLSAIGSTDTTVKYFNGANVELGSVVFKNTAGGGVTQAQPTNAQPTNVATTKNSSQPTTTKSQSTDFKLDTTIEKPFGINITNPSAGIIRIVWGAGNPNCYNVYIDGVRKRTKVAAASYDIPVQTEGKHIVGISHVNPYAMTESERVNTEIVVSGTAPEETTAIAEEDMPQHDMSVAQENGKMVLQLNNKTNGAYRDDQIYWVIVGRDVHTPTHVMSYLDANGNLIHANLSDNDGTVGDRKYSRKIVHTLAEKKTVQLPEIESGRMYISYGEPVYITFNGEYPYIGYAGPDLNNPYDANYHTLFEFLEFTTEGVNGGITFHGNTTRVDFFSFPMVARLSDEYGGYDRCVGDVGTRAEIFNAYRNEVSDKFDTLLTEERIMCPAKLTFGEGRQYGNYFDEEINKFWQKYANEDLVTSSEAGAFRGRVHGNRLIMSDGNGTYYVDKPTTQDVFEGRGAFNRISTENEFNDNGKRCELAIEAQLCAAFARGLALEPNKWWTVSEYYRPGTTRNEYAEFFHNHSVGRRAYGFCYDDVNDQSTLIECGSASRFTIDLKW